MSIAIDIESEFLETRNKKGGGTYQIQEAFAHTTDKNGKPLRYPERISLFPQRDASGASIPYKVGQYILSPQSIKVDSGFLALAFPVLIPMSEATKVHK
jgi:hypothetical protein